MNFLFHNTRSIPPQRTVKIEKETFTKLNHLGNVLISASSDCKLRLWNIESGNLGLAKTWRGGSGVPELMVSYGTMLFTSSRNDNTIRSWDLQYLERREDLRGHSSSITCMSSDSNFIYSGSYDKSIRIWDLAAPQSTMELKGHLDAVTSVRAIGHSVVSSSADGTLKLWDKRKPLAAVNTLDGTGYVNGCYIVDKYLVSYSRGGFIKLWKLKNGELKYKIETGYPIKNVVFTKKSIFSVGHNVIEIYHPNHHKGKKTTLEGHTADVNCTALYDQDYMFSGADDRTIRLWNIKKAQLVTLYQGHCCSVNDIVVIDRSLYSCSSDGTIRQWENCVFQSKVSEGWA